MTMKADTMRGVLRIKEYDKDSYKLLKKYSVNMPPESTYEQIQQNFEFRTMFSSSPNSIYKYDFIVYHEDIHCVEDRKKEIHAKNYGLKMYLKALEEERAAAGIDLFEVFRETEE